MVPMHVPEESAKELAAILGCSIGTFPQTYLGLPLSNEKLRLTAFAPLISKSDRYLSGWQATLLNPMGRTVLVNSVLDSQLIYAMSAMILPQGIIDAIDARRRAFLWTGDDKVSGAQCLVAWENACQQKEQGGLGLKNLAMQNKCLLLKLLHRLAHPGESSWARWIRARVNLVSLSGDVFGPHWNDLIDLLPMYRALTCCKVRDGKSTSFWSDKWHTNGKIADQFPALYSHSVSADISVADAARDGLHTYLVPRLTERARHELQKVEEILQSTQFTDEDDLRLCPLSNTPESMPSRPVYKLSMSVLGNDSAPFHDFVWKNTPSPVLCLDPGPRTDCRANLLKKNIVDDAACELCSAPSETCDCHILEQVWYRWEHLSRQVALDSTAAANHTTKTLQQLPPSFSAAATSENIATRSSSSPCHPLKSACKEAARLWSTRWPAADREIATSWCRSLSSM